MKKIIAICLFALLVVSATPAFAALTDTPSSISAKYGEYRMVVDTDNQLWTREDWIASGNRKAEPGGFMHYFDRSGMAIQSEVQYNTNTPNSTVRAQRFTPAGVIRIKDLKTYLPEIYELVTSPKAEVFTALAKVSRNLSDDASPLTLGVVVKQTVQSRGTVYTLIAFNVKDEGRLVKSAKYVTKDLVIQELSVERLRPADLDDPRGPALEWDWMRGNIFK